MAYRKWLARVAMSSTTGFGSPSGPLVVQHRSVDTPTANLPLSIQSGRGTQPGDAAATGLHGTVRMLRDGGEHDMAEHDWLADPNWPRVVTDAEWKPGLPPPIEALQARFRPQDGWEVEYATWIEASEDGRGRSIPIASADHPVHGSVMFFPERPRHPPGEPPRP
jgi:hypothetical protein